ncbi:hypothetical protein ASD40_30330 [Paenibacillus sp. Root444D2]|nr:hypothetical protein ASD40_30330 [Paenibacillus sp. Root444D2]
MFFIVMEALFFPHAYVSDENHPYGAENGPFQLQANHISMFFIVMELLLHFVHTLVMKIILMEPKMDHFSCKLII